MPCLLMLLALVAPRLLLFFILLLTDWPRRAFDSVLWPILGFFFAPYTTLAYLGAALNAGRVDAFWAVVIVVAALADVGSLAGGRSLGPRRRAAGRQPSSLPPDPPGTGREQKARSEDRAA